MRIKKLYLPIILATALAVGVLIGGYLNFSGPGRNFTANANRSKLNKLMELIESEYVDDVNTDSIVDLTVNGILEKLDPHSVYIAKNEMEQVTQSMKGDFVGIGVNFYMYNDSVAIIKPIENGPSEAAGLKAGDRILYAGTSKLFGRKLPSDSLFSKLKGEEGSKVNLTIYRKSEQKKFKVTITRGVVPIKSVDIAIMLNNKTGYIKINRFAETTYKEFHNGLLELKKLGATELIVDLRDNGGGYMEMAADIADEFLKDNELIVKTKNKKGNIDKTLATEEGNFENGKLYILINENSASASEILAGAIQDNDRGTIVGRRSFGKGLVQKEMPLGDGSAVRLTVARYYTPSGRSIQKPYNHGTDEYFSDFEKRFVSGELFAADSIKVADSLKFKTKKGRIVYGGGGIIPDIFVPIEGSHGDEALGMLMQSGLMSYFVFEQLDKDRKAFQGLTFPQMVAKLNATDAYFNNFKSYIAKSGLIFNLEAQKPVVKRYIAAEFARQLFDENKYFQIVLKEDAMVKAVLGRK
ncbi:carboxyl-terminal protease [Flavobacterium cauense R2A-7]|uniref:Carboxyl-terminal processing protease n=1 Tax=Flavobacterium cauense R2A-7 TaxID=1341154 RepID=V6S6D4_9FLAO|nr:S41 family peptidase [Flavobacterium cauense]ESU19960.1 carboxyl-terminal protease [Flavobacterium cauense R2A-7]KGO83767.1 peptidase S41 [Flavobacterium cauense R2A-7]TWI12385.1 carboxyl-terminal processing protease [Flavobacterium cauense R2A-7]